MMDLLLGALAGFTVYLIVTGAAAAETNKQQTRSRRKSA